MVIKELCVTESKYDSYQSEYDSIYNDAVAEDESNKALFNQVKSELLSVYQNFVQKYKKYGVWDFKNRYKLSLNKPSLDRDRFLRDATEYSPDDYIDMINKFEYDGSNYPFTVFNMSINNVCFYGCYAPTYDKPTEHFSSSVGDVYRLVPDWNDYKKDVSKIFSLERELQYISNEGPASVNTHLRGKDERGPVKDKYNQIYNVFGKYLQQGYNDAVSILKSNGYNVSPSNKWNNSASVKGTPSFGIVVNGVNDSDINNIKQLLATEELEVYDVAKYRGRQGPRMSKTDNSKYYKVLLAIWMPGLANKGKRPYEESSHLKIREHKDMKLNEAPAQIEQGVATVSIVDLVKQAYEKGLFTKLNCIGRDNACDLELGPMDKERLIGYFRKRKEFNVEEHNESGVYSVEFISNDYDIEIFDSFMRVYKIPQNEARKISAKEFKKLVTEWYVGEPDPTGHLEGEIRRQQYLNSDKFKEEKAYVISLANECKLNGCNIDDYELFTKILCDADIVATNTLWGIYKDTIKECSTVTESVEDSWESWTDVYAIFQGFLDKYWPDTDKVEATIDEFTGKYPDNKIVQQAVDRWCDPDCDFVPNPHTDLEEGFEEDEWSDEELANIYGGDTGYDIPDGVETPDETEARLRQNLVGEDDELVTTIQLQVEAGKRTPVKITSDEYYNMMDDCVSLPELTTDLSQGTGNVVACYVYNKKDDTVYCYADY